MHSAIGQQCVLLLVRCFHWTLSWVMVCSIWQPWYRFGLISLRSWLTWLTYIGILLRGCRDSCRACWAGISTGSLISCPIHLNPHFLCSDARALVFYTYARLHYWFYMTTRCLVFSSTKFCWKISMVSLLLCYVGKYHDISIEDPYLGLQCYLCTCEGIFMFDVRYHWELFSPFNIFFSVHPATYILAFLPWFISTFYIILLRTTNGLWALFTP